jgi:dipeptidyl aminopeptidase/acylaminoacyl peptidase
MRAIKRWFFFVLLIAGAVLMLLLPSAYAAELGSDERSSVLPNGGYSEPDTPAGAGSYRLPPKAIGDLVDLQPTPDLVLSPSHQWIVFAQDSPVHVKDLTQPSLRLAGLQINPETGNDQPNLGTAITMTKTLSLVRLADGTRVALKNLPTDGTSNALWSPDSQHFAFLHPSKGNIELWMASTERGEAWLLPGPQVNEAGPSIPGPLFREGFKSCLWMPDNRHLLCLTVPLGRGAAPVRSRTAGPTVQDTQNRPPGASGMYANLLKDSEDDDQFEYYATSQAQLVDIANGQRENLGASGVYSKLIPSPDARYFLSERLVRPYSRRVLYWQFARTLDVLDQKGKVVRHIATVPEASRPRQTELEVDIGPRVPTWQPRVPASLLYVEALDEGRLDQEAEYRDRLMLLEAPFSKPARQILKTRAHIDTNSEWGAAGLWTDDGRALVRELDVRGQKERIWLITMRGGDLSTNALWESPVPYMYAGDVPQEFPVKTTSPGADRLLRRDGDWVYFSGIDYPTEVGREVPLQRAILDRVNLRTRKRERLYQSTGERYEELVEVMDSQARQILTTVETASEPPEYVLKDLKTGSDRYITHFRDSGEYFRAFSDRRVELSFSRADGVRMAGDLFLPANYQEGTPLPVVIWSYWVVRTNLESARAAVERSPTMKVAVSPYRFTGFNSLVSMTELVRALTTQGCAVFYVDMPLVGESAPFESFIDQIDADARAAVEVLTARGIARPGSIGIAGQSAGGMIASTLLASSDLFAAGVSLSGGYQTWRSPFAFADERRSYWETPNSYRQISPWERADKIQAPLLLMHGEDDTNSLTPPAGAHAMFDALDGLGKTARLVMLPGEGHFLTNARESKLDVMAELVEWFDRYLKKPK